VEIERQLALLTGDDPTSSFAARMGEIGLYPLTADGLAILQMNITRRCNLCCKHCHVEAGPLRSEEMDWETMERRLEIAEAHGIGTAVEAIRELNRRGYGMADTGLILDLVHNPAGAYLPGGQAALEHEYRIRLRDEYGIEFNKLRSRQIAVREHCFACTAGAGSSCQGALESA
jgi:hypothetical protein